MTLDEFYEQSEFKNCGGGVTANELMKGRTSDVILEKNWFKE